MQTKTITLYGINELTPEARAKALEKYRYINVEDTNWESGLIEEFNAELEALGYTDTKILYSGFSSQGDGACFTGKIDLAKWLEVSKLAEKHKALYENAAAFACSITHSGHYQHERSTTLTIDIDSGSGIDEDIAQDAVIAKSLEAVEALIKGEMIELGSAFYKRFEKEFSHLIENDEVVNTLEINDWAFLEDGTPFNK